MGETNSIDDATYKREQIVPQCCYLGVSRTVCKYTHILKYVYIHAPRLRTYHERPINQIRPIASTHDTHTRGPAR